MRHGSSAALLLTLSLLTGPTAHAQAPAWQTAVVAGGTGSFVQAMAADAAGNVYLTGSLFGTVSFGGIALTSAGDADVFVAKWSSQTASFVWAQRAGGNGEDRALAVALNGTSVYVSGHFASATGGFGGTALVRSGPGPDDGFVAKLTDAGTSAAFVWAQRADERLLGVAATGTSVYVAGTLTRGVAAFGSTFLVNAGNYDAFVAKLTDAGTSGSYTWARRVGGLGYDYAGSVAASGTSIYLAGDFEDTADFGGTTLTSAGASDVFVAKLTDAGPTGSVVWAQSGGGPRREKAAGLAVSGASVYATGTFASALATFGPAALSNAGNTDVFVTKVIDAGPSGSFAWAQGAGGTDAEWAGAVAVSGSAVYLTGTFFSPSLACGATVLTNAGASDVYLAKLVDAGSSGAFAWAQQAGGTFFDQGWGVGISGSTVHVAGDIASPARFSVLTLSGTDPALLTGFIASVLDPTLTATTAATGSLSFALFPNPAHAAATVQLPAVPGTAAATLTLLDALGRTVRTETVALPATGLRHDLDLHGLPAGLYAVRVRAGTAAATRRLVVE